MNNIAINGRQHTITLTIHRTVRARRHVVCPHRRVSDTTDGPGESQTQFNSCSGRIC